MPIGIIFSLLNLIVNLFSKFFKLIVEKPQYLAILLLILLFFPLEFVDMFLYVLINFFVVLINVIILVIIIIFNVIFNVINFILTSIESVVNWIIVGVIYAIYTILEGIFGILDYFGLPTPTPPSIPGFSIPKIPIIPYSTITLSYFDINIFGPGGFVGITSLFDLFGLSSPVW